ncbi:unnamed protein product [Polarella glacialis]|uniref:Uncharacterized protein n=1 Tax=Polarella glacialis TaxID=89957 RepID=A0A813K653_POLGL|nr:unnamed protein product [Polarella glacialis]
MSLSVGHAPTQVHMAATDALSRLFSEHAPTVDGADDEEEEAGVAEEAKSAATRATDWELRSDAGRWAASRGNKRAGGRAADDPPWKVRWGR